VVIPTTGGGHATLAFGAVIAAVIQFVLVALVVYFALIVPINYLKRISFRKKEHAIGPEETPPTELELLAEIRDLLAKSPVEGRHSGD
jgi:large conductance mechanosensitive channel